MAKKVWPQYFLSPVIHFARDKAAVMRKLAAL
jgi:hypothetical protein